MALVVLPEGQQRSGKQGGIVWSHNAGGPYVRNRAIPVNPNTDRQVAVRNAVRGLAIHWQITLTQNQRDAWDTYGANVSWTNRLGQTITLSGLNHYIRSNTPRLAIGGLARFDDAPIIFDLAVAEQALSAVGSAATQDLTVDGDPLADWIADPGAAQFYYMGLPQNSSRKYFSGPWRYGTVACIGPPPFPVTLPAPWPIADGQRIWLRSRVQRSDGRLSEFAQINFLGAA